MSNEDQQNEVNQRLADLETVYWSITSDNEIFIKRGRESQYASVYYPHSDPAGVFYWHLDNRTVSKKELAAVGVWSSDPVPNAKDYAEVEK